MLIKGNQEGLMEYEMFAVGDEVTLDPRAAHDFGYNPVVVHRTIRVPEEFQRLAEHSQYLELRTLDGIVLRYPGDGKPYRCSGSLVKLARKIKPSSTPKKPAPEKQK